MGKYIKKFDTHSDYEDFIQTEDYIRPNISHCVLENEVHYNPYVYDYSQDYLTFVALEDGQFSFMSNNDGVISYSLDNGETWTELTAEQPTPTITAGNKVIWKSTLSSSDDGYSIGTFGSTAEFDIQGNVMSLLYGDNFKGQLSLAGKNYAFDSLFLGCNIVNARNLILPATTLAESCYLSMFRRCRNLTAAPVLPATTLTRGCYYRMFEGCTSLTTAPQLSAETLAETCYAQMFQDCTSLTNAPELPATTLAWQCYQTMFYGCTSLTMAPELPATALHYECYGSMFQGCTSLINAPELPATTLVEYCYHDMFFGCTSLTSVAAVPSTVKPVGGEYCCGMYALTNIQQSADYDASAWSEEC